ncbi:hypothetical protein Phi46:3_gp001 [Cellulophaga phage phi46:3]|uniref:Uncharacterized protein n=2 Tax=Pachyviridae TaxID=2946166 RepID=S0A2U6_9CAUD|nr:hypothetical protein Phi46:3_gp001 [Cellulophaga phage phi46:3]YP_008241194.1 hypothetical protein Phi18:3_gp001 [Cellulophaga phage phi18:3]AGO48513.1 hypothetical protein Phi18:3_gp001 [Cellulophaga phage phi18:3]AGO48745.1 hypothetical protein Phi46:3_gp001 [Cellulophaga phage phi46:3]
MTHNDENIYEVRIKGRWSADKILVSARNYAEAEIKVTEHFRNDTKVKSLFDDEGSLKVNNDDELKITDISFVSDFLIR